MNKSLILLLITSHIVGDYYLQSQYHTKEKLWSSLNLFKQACLYAFAYGPILIFTEYDKKIIFVMIIIHAIIDYLFFFLSKHIREGKSDLFSFIMQRVCHLASILMITYLCSNNINSSLVLSKFGMAVNDFLQFYNIDVEKLIIITFVTVIIHKPMNVFIAQFLDNFKISLTQKESNISAGRYIGSLERLIVLILLSIKQYSAIGLVLTAKSITRYEKIQEEPEFGEYYLLGTLLSLLSVIILAQVIL